MQGDIGATTAHDARGCLHARTHARVGAYRCRVPWTRCMYVRRRRWSPS